MSELKKRDKSSNTKKPPIENDSPKKLKNKTNANQNLPLRVLSRIVVITSLLIVVYFSSRDENMKTFAKQSELIVGKSQIVQCSTDYLEEVQKYGECHPKQCKRLVTDKVISSMEADDLLALAKKGLALGGSSGGASILDFQSGALSKGQHFINIYKMKEAENLFTDNDFNMLRVIKQKVKYAVAHHFNLNPEKVFLTSPSFFSEITSKKAVTMHDEYWHPHVDKETYKTFHYTSLLYLGDYGIDFEGGRFVFIDEKYNRTIEPRKGRVSMFTSGGENVHFVEKVTSGVRYAVTIAFTCDKQFEVEHVNKQ